MQSGGVVLVRELELAEPRSLVTEASTRCYKSTHEMSGDVGEGGALETDKQTAEKKEKKEKKGGFSGVQTFWRAHTGYLLYLLYFACFTWCLSCACMEDTSRYWCKSANI